MNLTWNARAVLVVSAMAVLLIANTSSPGQRPRPGADAGPPTATGKVLAYEADKSITIEVRQRGGLTKKVEFALVKDKTKLELLGATKTIAVGTEVRIWADKDNPSTAARIAAGAAVNAAGPTATGKVLAYEADKSITVEVKRRGGEVEKKEFVLSKDRTKIELLGAVKAIEVGTEVRIWADSDNPKNAARISAGTATGRRPAAPPAPPANPPPANPAPALPAGQATLGGTLQGLDAAKNTVTVATSNRATGKVERTFELAKDLEVLRDGKPAKVGDLKKGGSISVKLSPDQKSVVSISETGKRVGAPLKSIDAENNTITLTVIEGRERIKKDVTHQLAKDGKVTLEGKEVKLADLKDVRPGSTIQLTFSVDDDKKLIHIQYAPGRR
jgi:ribosomal protein S17